MKRWLVLILVPMMALVWAGCGDDLENRVKALEETVEDLDTWALQEYEYQKEVYKKLLTLYEPDNTAGAQLEPEIIRRLRADLIKLCKRMVDSEISDVDCDKEFDTGPGDTTPPPKAKKYPPDD